LRVKESNELKKKSRRKEERKKERKKERRKEKKEPRLFYLQQKNNCCL